MKNQNIIEDQKNNVTAKIVTASEKLVDYLLSLNTDNRPIKPTVVEKYVRDLENNNWYLTNQGIGVYSDNVLADGQHRLEAIKQSKRFDQKILLVEGLSRNALKGIDQHAKRTHRDLARLVLGVALNNRSIAMSNVIFRAITKFARKQNKFISPSFDETQQILEFYLHEFNVLNSANKRNFIAAGILSAFVVKHKISNYSDQIKIEKLIEQVANGEMLKKGTNAHTLFSYVISGKKSQGGCSTQLERFLKSYAICTYLLEGVDLTKMYASEKVKNIATKDLIQTLDLMEIKNQQN